MSSDDNHWRAHMTPTARNICTCAVFATTSFNFGLPTCFVSHYCYRRTLHAVFYGRVVEQSCLNVVWKMRCQRSHICWCVSCWHHVFVLLVQLALVHLKISFCLARDWCRFPSRRLPYTSIFLSIFFLRSMFAFIPLFVDFVRYLTFWHHMIQIQILKHKVCWLFCVLDMPLWKRSGIISSVEDIRLDIPLT